MFRTRVVGLLRRSRHYDHLRPVLLMMQRSLLALRHYSWRDRERLVTFLYDLQRHQNDTKAVLDRPPISILTDINQQFEAARVGAAALLYDFLSRLPLPRRRNTGRLPSEVREFKPSRRGYFRPLSWLRGKIRGVLLRGARTAEVASMHSFARKAIYDLVTRNGDLNGALPGFELLTRLESQPNAEFSALDKLMLNLVPHLISVENDIGSVKRSDVSRRGLVISAVVWGEAYADLFERYTLASLMAPGNLPAIAKQVNVTWHIFTTAALRKRLEQHPAFQPPFNVRFEEIPENLISLAAGDGRYWLFGGLTHTSFRLAFRLGADLHFLNPDTVYSANYFENLYGVVGIANTTLMFANSFRTDKRGIVAELETRRSGEATIAISARTLHSLGLKHLHPSSRSVFVTGQQLSAPEIPRSTIFMWPEGSDVAVRSAHYQPIFVSNGLLTKSMRLSYFTVDSTVFRRWGHVQSVAASTYVVRPTDDIGYFEISSSNQFSISRVNRSQYAREFWETNTRSEFLLFGKEFQLPVAELPAGLPDASLALSTREAFLRLYEEVRVARPKSQEDEDRVSSNLTIPDLVGVSDTVYGLEVREGGGPMVEALVDDLRAAVKEGRTFYEVAAIDDAYLGRMYINFLRLGLLDELKLLNDRHKFRLGGATALLNTFVELCGEQFEKATNDGKQWRAGDAGSQRFTLSCTVWGDEYVRNFMNFNVRSMLAPGNLPGLAKIGACKIFVVTNESGRAAIEAHPVFAETLKYVDWEFAVVPQAIITELVSPEMERYFYILYGMLDHIGIFYAQGAESNLFMIPVDAIVANGSFVNMANYRNNGFECCGGGNIVANTETFLPALEEKFAGQPAITISTEDLASLAVEHAHHYFISQIISAENQDFGMHARELFWPVPGGVEIHSCFIHPLFVASTAVARYTRKHFANVDYGMIPRIFNEPDRIKIVGNTDEAYINNFATRKRRYETTGAPFEYDVFLRAHAYTYPVQKALFIHGQTLKARYNGITANRDLAADVQALSKRLTGERTVS